MTRRIKLPRSAKGSNSRRRKVEEDWEQEFELRWPVYEYEIVATPNQRLATVLRFERLQWPDGGVFTWKGWVEREEDEWVPTRVKAYDPVEESEEILKAVTRLDTESPQALLRFVNTWGCLGVGIPGEEAFLFDGVALTGKMLRLLKEWSEWLHNLRQGRAKGSWEDFAVGLNAMLLHVNPAARPTPGGVEPVYRVSRLVDALFVRLWMQATEAQRFRRCPECHALFVPGRRDQKYCSPPCVNRFNVRRWRRRQRRKRKGGY